MTVRRVRSDRRAGIIVFPQMTPPRRRATVVALVAASLIALPALPAVAAPTLQVSVTPAFSPNGDGRLDDAVITVTVDTLASVDVRVTDADGAPVKDLVDAALVDGSRGFTWHGFDDADTRAADGRYLVKVTSPDSAPAVAPVALDTSAPKLVWISISPEPIRTTDPVRFSFDLADRLSDQLRLAMTVEDVQGRLVDREVGLERQVGARSVSWDARLAGGQPAAPGLYRARFTLVDEAGNARTTRARPFRDERPVSSVAIRRVEGAGPRVALTFDDCVYGDAWRRIVTTLEAAGATATFFCNGTNLADAAGQARRTVRAGMAIGSHTWDHADLLGMNAASIRTEVAKDEAAWWRIARTTPAPYFRPPNGDYDKTVLGAVGDEGFRWTVLWDVDPQDWSGISADEIRRRVVGSARSGSIVVLHVRPRTAAALPSILGGLRRAGLRCVSITDLLRAGGLIS